MHRQDYEDLAAAVRAGVEAAEWGTQPGGALASFAADQVRRVAAALVAEMADRMADRDHTFTRSAWLDACGLSAEVSALRPVTPVRRYGAPLAFDDVRVGDWVRYEGRPGFPIVGRVQRHTDKTVRTEHDYALTFEDMSWSEGTELRRSRWDRLHVELVDPAEVWRQDVVAKDGEPEGIPAVARKPDRVPRAEAPQRAMEAARAYLARRGDLRVPTKHVEGGYRLGGWISSQRYDYRHHCLNPDRLRELDALHVSWRHGIADGGAKA